jgi:hypothetical protein
MGVLSSATQIYKNFAFTLYFKYSTALKMQTKNLKMEAIWFSETLLITHKTIQHDKKTRP